MVQKIVKTNPYMNELIVHLKKLSLEKKIPLWKAVARELEKSRRMRREVNLEKINRICRDNETIIVPGKVLALGELYKKVTVAAFSFSDSAYAKINEKGKAMSIQELLQENPQGSGVRIIG